MLNVCKKFMKSIEKLQEANPKTKKDNINKKTMKTKHDMEANLTISVLIDLTIYTLQLSQL